MDQKNKSTIQEKAISIIDEFRNFAFKGNMINLAIGIIIGTAFGKLINALVMDIFMPFIGLLLPGQKGYLAWKWVIHGQTIPYGLFIGEIVNFLVVAIVLFIFAVKFLGWLAMVRNDEENIEQPPTKDQELLMEIRDLLKEKENNQK